MYAPPIFKELAIRTDKIEQLYSNLLARYKIVPKDNNSTSDSSQLPKGQLEILLSRMQDILTCNTQRTTQRDVFSTLMNEFRKFKQKDSGEEDKATFILLGALLHRYFRIIEESKLKNSWNPMSYFKSYVPALASDPKNCQLFIKIRTALNLPDINYKNYKEEDLKVLDLITIIDSLEYFREYMYQLDSNKTANYTKYDHFKADVNFKSHLDEIINTQKAKGKEILIQFNAIRFLKSLKNQLAQTESKLSTEISSWINQLVKDYPDFQKIDLKILQEHVQKNLTPQSSSIISSLIQSPLIALQLKSLNHQSLKENLLNLNSGKSSYILMGGYGLILSLNILDKDLTTFLYKALGVEEKEDITQQDFLNSMTIFQQYLEGNTSLELFSDVFGGREKLESTLMKQVLCMEASCKSSKNTENDSEKDLLHKTVFN